MCTNSRKFLIFVKNEKKTQWFFVMILVNTLRDLFYKNYYIILIIGYYDGNIYFFSNAICTALIVITLS